MNGISPGAVFTPSNNGLNNSGYMVNGIPNGIQNGIQNGLPPQYTTLPMTGVGLLPNSGSVNGGTFTNIPNYPAYQPAYTQPLPSANDNNVATIALGEPLSFNVIPTLQDPEVEEEHPTTTPESTLEKKKKSQKKEIKPESDEEEDDEEKEEPKPEKKRKSKEVEKKEPVKEPKSIMKPARPVTPDASPLPKKRPPSIINEPPAKVAVKKQNSLVENPVEAPLEDDKCLGCSKRTCAILWFVSFLLTLLGLISALSYFFIRDALDITRFECDTGPIRKKITTEPIGTIPTFPFSYTSPIFNQGGQAYGRWNTLSPATTALLLDGDRTHLIRRRPDREVHLVWHCGCSLTVNLYDTGSSGVASQQHTYKVGNVLKLSDAYPMMKMLPTKWYSISLLKDNCYLDMALITITPMGTNNPVIVWSV